MPNLLTLLAQISVIVLMARLVGWIFRKMHQPQVMGEIVAGVLLGPSLLGWMAPGVSQTLFPPDSLGFLNAISQIGIVMFMFLVGLKLDPTKLRGHGHAAVVISHASITVPFVLGTLLALYLYPRLSDPTITLAGFALFMGAAMSVTAFPVLAHILTESKLSRTRVGTVALVCAAANDVTAWCILAGVVALVRSATRESSLWLTLMGSAAFIVVMLVGARRAFRCLESRYREAGQLTQDMLALILLLVVVTALATEWLGIHALFGAFLVGVVMPKDPGFVSHVSQKLEGVTMVFLLPLFFALTGLRTSLHLVTGVEMWFYLALITLVAIAGKFGGATISARLMGMSWPEAVALGALMNTRGLIELVILNIGLEIGIISPALFAMMVVMAFVTTLMAMPVLQWTRGLAGHPLPHGPMLHDDPRS